MDKGVNENRWSIGYVLPTERVYVELRIIKYDIAAVAATAVLVSMLSYFTGKYVTGPIRELAAAAGKVAAGEMPTLDVKSDDEIGRLSRAFGIMAEAVKRRDEALRALAVTDGLTGLYNHRHFKEALEASFKAARRFNRPLSLLMADIDHFKHYNDAHGHTYGDTALKRVAELFAENVRAVDTAARYGGEEFVMILPETRLNDAALIAERIRKKILDEVFPFEETQPNGNLTVSIGAAELDTEMPDALGLVNAADKALYNAKHHGRNMVWPKV